MFGETTKRILWWKRGGNDTNITNVTAKVSRRGWSWGQSNEVPSIIVGVTPLNAEGQHLRRQLSVIELTVFIGGGIVKLMGGVGELRVQYGCK